MKNKLIWQCIFWFAVTLLVYTLGYIHGSITEKVAILKGYNSLLMKTDSLQNKVESMRLNKIKEAQYKQMERVR